MNQKIPFNRSYRVGTEAAAIEQVIAAGHLSAEGPCTLMCRQWLEQRTGTKAALLVQSCTAALELCALLLDIGPGDEVILPSYTFVTSASAFVLRGATPVFVDIRPDTLNIDENLIEAAITEKTKAIVPTHYAGVAAEMDAICGIGERYGIPIVEDAAQGIMATYRDRALGTLGSLGAVSFHETKNVTCGEGGALFVNDPAFIERAEILREKGTNRSQFLRGHVDKYTWVDVGSSYALSDINAAFLSAQLEAAEEITARRIEIWDQYHQAFSILEEQELVRRPIVPEGCTHNAHLYYLLLPSESDRNLMLQSLNDKDGINAVFHYVPLHSSSVGRSLGREHGSLKFTNDLAGRLLRLPLWPGMTNHEVDRVITAVSSHLRTGNKLNSKIMNHSLPSPTDELVPV